MKSEHTLHYFLGANSGTGFYSLYDSLANLHEGDFLWVIKGGPGCGKSSFMRKIGKAAEERGYAVEYTLCSGDPKSLDAVYIPELKTAYADGTAPHVIEAVYPGSASLYLDLGTFYDARMLEDSLNDIIAINKSYKALYERAYRYLASAAGIYPKDIIKIYGEKELRKVRRKVAGYASRELRDKGCAGKAKQRFLSAWSCMGNVFLQSTVDAQCSRVITLDNEYGLGHVYLKELEKTACARGYDLIVCPDPLLPTHTEAVIIPETETAFIACDSARQYEGDTHRHLRLDALIEKDTLAAIRPLFRKTNKIYQQLLSSAVETLEQAKALHDELEGIYNPCVDFPGIYTTANDHISWLFGE